jgi:hypothetical protein
VSVTIDSSPEMTDAVTVDGSTISTPETYSWQVGSVHTLIASADSSNYNGQYGYEFDNWVDEYTGSILSYNTMFSYTVPSTSDEVEAVFTGPGQGNYCLQYEGNVCVQWQTQGNYCLQYEGNVCVQWQGNTEVVSTQTMRVTTTSSLFTTMVSTTTGYATTQVSTTAESVYVTALERSYEIITNTQYVYVTSNLPNNTSNNSPTTAGGALLNLGSLVAGVTGYVNGYLPVPLLAMAGAAAILLLVSALTISRRRRGKVTEQAGDSIEMEAMLLDYINAHKGAISMSQASEDLGVSRERLGEAIMRLKAVGKLPQAWTQFKVGGE